MRFLNPSFLWCMLGLPALAAAALRSQVQKDVLADVDVDWFRSRHLDASATEESIPGARDILRGVDWNSLAVNDRSDRHLETGYKYFAGITCPEFIALYTEIYILPPEACLCDTLDGVSTGVCVTPRNDGRFGTLTIQFDVNGIVEASECLTETADVFANPEDLCLTFNDLNTTPSCFIEGPTGILCPSSTCQPCVVNDILWGFEGCGLEPGCFGTRIPTNQELPDGSVDPTDAPVPGPTDVPVEDPTEAPVDAPVEECSTIAEIACSRDDFRTLCELAQIFQLDDDLSGGTWTVFAPNNAAFAAIADTLATLDPDGVLDVLLFHAVAETAIVSTDLVCDGFVTMANGQDSQTICGAETGTIFQVGEGNLPDLLPAIISTDIEACNGIVHIVDNVMLPALSTVPPETGDSAIPSDMPSMIPSDMPSMLPSDVPSMAPSTVG